MSRSIWKGIIPKSNRNSTITPEDVGKVVEIENKKYKNVGKVIITTQHIGHKYGEYIMSKIPAVYKRNSKKK